MKRIKGLIILIISSFIILLTACDQWGYISEWKAIKYVYEYNKEDNSYGLAIMSPVIWRDSYLKPTDDVNYLYESVPFYGDDLVLPSYYNGLPIKSIISVEFIFSTSGTNVFRDDIHRIIIPDTVEKIDNNAFANAKNIKEVVMPDSVKSIGYSAFLGCSNLRKINLSKNLEVIGSDAFNGCESLENLEFPDSLKTIYNNAFEQSGLRELKLTNVNLIGASAFRGCSNLEHISLPNKLIEIEATAFADTRFTDNSGKNVYYVGNDENPYMYLIGTNGKVSGDYHIMDGCMSIAPYAFYQTEITSISIPESVIKIGEYAFSECMDLEQVDLNGKLVKISKYTFGNCESLKDISIPNTVQKIEEYAFYKTHIETLNIPDSVAEIGDDAFASCQHLKNLTLSKRLRIIGRYAFDNCLSLEELILPNSVEEMGTSAFGHCKNLKKITLSNNLETISSAAFYESAIEKIVIPNGVKVIDANAFASCYNLEEVTLPETLVEVRLRAFQSSNIKSITIPKSVRYIGLCSFAYSKQLTTVNYENFDLIQSFGEQAFYQTAIDTVELPKNMEIADNQTFDTGCLKKVYLKDGCQNVSSQILEKLLGKSPLQFSTSYGNGMYLGTVDNPYYALIYFYDKEYDFHPDCKLIATKACPHNREKVIVPEGVETICDQAFVLATSVYLSNSVKYISKKALINVSNIYLPRDIHFGLFDYSKNCEIYYDGTIEEFTKTSFYLATKKYANYIIDIHCKDGAIKVGWYA